MKTITKLLLVLLVLIGITTSAYGLEGPDDLNLPTQPQPQEPTPSEIDSVENASIYFDLMEITIDVTETGLVKVNTKIDAFFNSNYNRGIEVYLPQKYTMNFNDPETSQRTTKTYYWPVENLQNKSVHPMNSTTVENRALRIRFGEQNIFVKEAQSYEYSYEVQTRDLNYRDLEMFYWNIVGDLWNVPMKKVNFTVNFPKPLEYPLYVYAGRYQNTENDLVQYQLSDDQMTLSGTTTRPVQRFEAITIQTDFNQGYFDFPYQIDWLLPISGAGIVGALLSIFWFFKYGRDEHMTITTEIGPPEGLSSAMVGYIYDGRADTQDVLSLIIEWASFGYMSIEENEDTNDFIFTKLRELPQDTVSFEQRLFDQLFKDREAVSTSDLEYKFYKHIHTAQLGLDKHFRNKERRVYNQTSNAFQSLSIFMSGLLIAAMIFYQTYVNSYSFPLSFIVGVVGLFVALAYTGIQKSLFEDITQRGSFRKLLNIILSLVTTALLMLIYWTFTLATDTKLSLYSLIVFITYLIIVICSINMAKRTPFGVTKLGKILGLKQFIEVAEKENLERYVEDDPSFFYKVLPYAYVLGVSDIWSKKFEGLAAVPMNGGSVVYSPQYYAYNLDRMMRQTTRSMTSQPVSVSSSGSSWSSGGGGGFSGGGGGGGFSGGGFGGGGGGGWR